MLTYFGTLFAIVHIYHYLTNLTNIWHAFCYRQNLCVKLFHVKQIVNLCKWFKLVLFNKLFFQSNLYMKY